MALTALSMGALRSEAAAKAGVSERTLYNWLKDSDFKACLGEAIESQYFAVMAGLTSGAVNAARYLKSVVVGEDTPNAHRIQAATALLNASNRTYMAYKLQQIEDRLAGLEGPIDIEADS